MRAFASMFVIALIFFACGGEDENAVAENCMELFCPFVGVWRLNQLSADGSPVNDNLVSYRLDLKKPASGSPTGGYQRTFANGEGEVGTWSVGNNGNVITLSSPDGLESYIVESVGVASLVLIFEREDVKPGPDLLRYAFTK
jgi:hypothetical protein